MPFATILVLLVAGVLAGYFLGGWWVVGAILLFFAVGVAAIVVRLYVTYDPNKKQVSSPSGREISYCDFQQLVGEKTYRKEMDGFLTEYFGCRISDKDGGAAILNERGEEMDQLKLHNEIQDSEEMQLELYALAMSLWR